MLLQVFEHRHGNRRADQGSPRELCGGQRCAFRGGDRPIEDRIEVLPFLRLHVRRTSDRSKEFDQHVDE